MKTLGLIGGTSWLSTVEYYRLLNEGVAARLGGLNSAKCILYSLNFAEAYAFNQRQDWDGALEIIDRMAKDEGTQGAILGCTEIPLLIRQSHTRTPVFDTTALHAAAAVDFMLSS